MMRGYSLGGGHHWPKGDEIIARQLCHFCRADLQLGLGVTAGLGVKIDQLLPQEVVPV
jgi:catalase